MYYFHRGFPGDPGGKIIACNAGNSGLIPESGTSSGEGNDPLQSFLPGKFRGQSSLVGHNPWGCKELGTTEQLTLSLLSQPDMPSESFKKNDKISCELQRENGLLDIESTSMQKHTSDIFQLFR